MSRLLGSPVDSDTDKVNCPAMLGKSRTSNPSHKFSIEHVLSLLGVITTLLMGMVSAYVAYNINSRGNITSPKSLEETLTGPTNSISQINTPENVRFFATINGKTFDNFFTASLKIVNNGSSPILPSDIYEKISLKVNQSWKILSVSSISAACCIHFDWQRISDREFDADPTLLNPSDQSLSFVYITKDSTTDFPTMTADAPLLLLGGRVVNMKSFSNGNDKPNLYSSGLIQVSIYDIGILFFLISFITYQSIYIFAFYRTKVFAGKLINIISLLLGASVISAASSEASCTYLFGTVNGNYINYNVQNYWNAPWIVLNFLLIVYFSFFFSGSKKDSVDVS